LQFHTGDDIVNYTGCRDDIAGGLTKVLWTASQLDDLSDFDDLLDAIRVLRPRWTGAGTVVAWRHLRRQSWIDALRVLEDDDLEAKRSGLHSALMAVCLFGMQDPLWQSYARTAAEQREHREASDIGSRLLERAAKLDSSVRAPVESAPAGPVSAAAPAWPAAPAESITHMPSSWVRA
jgi:type III secretion protein HrpB1